MFRAILLHRLWFGRYAPQPARRFIESAGELFPRCGGQLIAPIPGAATDRGILSSPSTTQRMTHRLGQSQQWRLSSDN
jgi:hypothetical protein